MFPALSPGPVIWAYIMEGVMFHGFGRGHDSLESLKKPKKETERHSAA